MNIIIRSRDLYHEKILFSMNSKFIDDETDKFDQ
jgi:hypothetical protein